MILSPILRIICFFSVLLSSVFVSFALPYGQGIYDSGDYGVGQNCVDSWSCTDWSTCSSGTQTRTCTDSNSCPAENNQPSESQSCGSGGSSGGGGGGGSSSSDTDVKETVSLTTGADSGETKTITFTENIAVTEMDITFQNDVAQASVTVKKMDSRPLEIIVPIGTVHSYLKIDTDLEYDDIEKAKIRFKVEKSWLLTKGVLADEIVLKRYGSKWETLPTTKIKDDNDYTYYEAEANGFSYFVIAAEKKPAAVPMVEDDKESDNVSTELDPLPQPKTQDPAIQPNRKLSMALATSLIIAGIIGLIFFLKKKPSKK